MRTIIQRVTKASVTVGDELISSIGRGLCILVGISKDDTPKEREYLVRKILNLRVFDDENDKRWAKSVKDKQLEILCVSQFTLYSILKGNKPDFHQAMPGDQSQTFYNEFLDMLRKDYHPDKIKDGKFGAHMQVHIQNDGPVTIQIEAPPDATSSSTAQESSGTDDLVRHPRQAPSINLKRKLEEEPVSSPRFGPLQTGTGRVELRNSDGYLACSICSNGLAHVDGRHLTSTVCAMCGRGLHQECSMHHQCDLTSSMDEMTEEPTSEGIMIHATARVCVECHQGGLMATCAGCDSNLHEMCRPDHSCPALAQQKHPTLSQILQKKYSKYGHREKPSQDQQPKKSFRLERWKTTKDCSVCSNRGAGVQIRRRSQTVCYYCKKGLHWECRFKHDCEHMAMDHVQPTDANTNVVFLTGGNRKRRDCVVCSDRKLGQRHRSRTICRFCKKGLHRKCEHKHMCSWVRIAEEAAVDNNLQESFGENPEKKRKTDTPTHNSLLGNGGLHVSSQSLSRNILNHQCNSHNQLNAQEGFIPHPHLSLHQTQKHHETQAFTQHETQHKTLANTSNVTVKIEKDDYEMDTSGDVAKQTDLGTSQELHLHTQQKEERYFVHKVNGESFSDDITDSTRIADSRMPIKGPGETGEEPHSTSDSLPQGEPRPMLVKCRPTTLVECKECAYHDGFKKFTHLMCNVCGIGVHKKCFYRHQCRREPEARRAPSPKSGDVENSLKPSVVKIRGNGIWDGRKDCIVCSSRTCFGKRKRAYTQCSLCLKGLHDRCLQFHICGLGKHHPKFDVPTVSSAEKKAPVFTWTEKPMEIREETNKLNDTILFHPHERRREISEFSDSISYQPEERGVETNNFNNTILFSRLERTQETNNLNNPILFPHRERSQGSNKLNDSILFHPREGTQETSKLSDTVSYQSEERRVETSNLNNTILFSRLDRTQETNNLSDAILFLPNEQSQETNKLSDTKLSDTNLYQSEEIIEETNNVSGNFSSGNSVPMLVKCQPTSLVDCKECSYHDGYKKYTHLMCNVCGIGVHKKCFYRHQCHRDQETRKAPTPEAVRAEVTTGTFVGELPSVIRITSNEVKDGRKACDVCSEKIRDGKRRRARTQCAACRRGLHVRCLAQHICPGSISVTKSHDSSFTRLKEPTNMTIPNNDEMDDVIEEQDLSMPSTSNASYMTTVNSHSPMKVHKERDTRLMKTGHDKPCTVCPMGQKTRMACSVCREHVHFRCEWRHYCKASQSHKQNNMAEAELNSTGEVQVVPIPTTDVKTRKKDCSVCSDRRAGRRSRSSSMCANCKRGLHRICAPLHKCTKIPRRSDIVDMNTTTNHAPFEIEVEDDPDDLGYVEINDGITRYCCVCSTSRKSHVTRTVCSSCDRGLHPQCVLLHNCHSMVPRRFQGSQYQKRPIDEDDVSEDVEIVQSIIDEARHQVMDQVQEICDDVYEDEVETHEPNDREVVGKVGYVSQKSREFDTGTTSVKLVDERANASGEIRKYLLVTNETYCSDDSSREEEDYSTIDSTLDSNEGVTLEEGKSTEEKVEVEKDIEMGDPEGGSGNGEEEPEQHHSSLKNDNEHHQGTSDEAEALSDEASAHLLDIEDQTVVLHETQEGNVASEEVIFPILTQSQLILECSDSPQTGVQVDCLSTNLDDANPDKQMENNTGRTQDLEDIVAQFRDELNQSLGDAASQMTDLEQIDGNVLAIQPEGV